MPGDLFVIGDGDCGQFGLGEDVVEATRPVPTVAGGQKVCTNFFCCFSCFQACNSEGLYVATLQTLQVAAGGMHSVALTEDFQVYTTGVNDEAALGRFTGASTLLLKQHTCMYVRLIWGVAAAASEAWKNHEDGKEAGDSYTWGKVDMPATHGHVVQVSAGMLQGQTSD